MGGGSAASEDDSTEAPRSRVDVEDTSMAQDAALDTLLNAIAQEVVLRIKNSFPGEHPRVQAALLTVREAGVYLGRSEQAVQHLIFKRQLPVVRVGRRVHLDRRDLDAWIENNKC